ncbi:MAG: DUF4476 domain-containing protein [Chitinophagaceae bacterium]|nr:DUF4476 domain-containing protein [Chitinophagaceae bacterium]
MKQVSVYLIILFTALSVQAQQPVSSSAVTISVYGNKNLRVSVDGKEYNLFNTIISGSKSTLTINNLEMGQHTLLFTRTDQPSNRTGRISTTFNLRYKFDMLIKLNGNGSLELIETLKPRMVDNPVPMNAADFTILLRNVRNQRSVIARRTIIANAFNVTNNYFTSNQVVQLLQLVNAENYRLELAKLSYRSVTDRSNFNQLYYLLNSQSSRNELEDYVNNYQDDYDQDEPDEAMSDANFNNLYQSIQQQWPVSTQMNSLTNAFNATNNYFSIYQASRLIQLVNAENNRLQLAKLSYRAIIDRNNFNQIYNLLSSQSSKNELTAYVNNYRDGDNQDLAMSDANFNNLYQSIQQQWPVSTQMNSLTNAFNATNNYFSTYQASRLIQLVNAESNRLQLAKLSYRTITDRYNFNQIYNLFNSQASKNELAAYVNNYQEDVNQNVVMSDANFNNLYQSIQQQWPVSTQMNSLTNAFNATNNYFSTYQASRLIQLVNAESNRLQLAKLSYRVILDRNNFNQIYNLLSSQVSKNELATYINTNYNTGSSPHVAMSDAEFTVLFQTIERQYLPFEQMNSLTEVFNNTRNYFTTAQVKRLIPLVSLESNRIQLAKLSYRTIIDRANFSQLYDLIESQAGRNELDAYVNAYQE